MADDIVVDEIPAIVCMQNELMKAMSLIRMMKTYVETHISTSTDGPNDGNAGPDLINGCDSVNESLDCLYNYLDSLDMHVVRPFLEARVDAPGDSSSGSSILN